MNLVKHICNDKLIKIFVYSLDKKEKVDELLEQLIYGFTYEIILLDIKILPLSILLRFEELKTNIHLIVNESKLKYYLLNLGFAIDLISQENLSYGDTIDNIEYIALGGSAGSLQKFIDIVKYLPSSSLTFFIIMHQKSDMKSHLRDILQKYTSHYKVVEAKNDIKVQPSTIYVAPSNKHLIVLQGYIFLTNEKAKHFSKPSISVSFDSLSNEYHNKLMAILVCGYGADGSDSLKNIRDKGGIVILEQLYECQATAMLENAINTKQFDKILSCNDISKLLYDKITKENNIEIDLDDFLEEIYLQYGYDYRDYHKKHIVRRIEHSCNILHQNNFKEFQQKVLSDKAIFQKLFLDISVNVTTFFRNPHIYKNLKKEIKNRFQDRQSIKIWCAGCSSGEEPYSIAIILKELGLLDKSLIYATDINDVILQFAKNGVYSKKSYVLFKEYYKKANNLEKFSKYFNHYDHFVTVKDEIKEKILFFRHNLATDGVLNEFQLIICRNVIIYFNKDLTVRVFDLFNDSLGENGMLILGESETFYNKYNYRVLDETSKIYLKNGKVDG